MVVAFESLFLASLNGLSNNLVTLGFIVKQQVAEVEYPPKKASTTDQREKTLRKSLMHGREERNVEYRKKNYWL